MSDTIVWAFKPLKELNGETGMVQCDEELAAKLIEAGDVQDTRDGALHFKEIEAGGEYMTKVMTPRKPRASKASTESEE